MTQQDEQIKRQLQEDMSKYELDDAVKVYILSQARPSIWERTVRFRLSRAIAYRLFWNAAYCSALVAAICGFVAREDRCGPGTTADYIYCRGKVAGT